MDGSIRDFDNAVIQKKKLCCTRRERMLCMRRRSLCGFSGITNPKYIHDHPRLEEWIFALKVKENRATFEPMYGRLILIPNLGSKSLADGTSVQLLAA